MRTAAQSLPGVDPANPRPGPLRIWSTSSAAGDLALRKAELRRSHGDDQTSILRFIEDNWLGGQRIGGGSFDSIASSINGMFEFRRDPGYRILFLNESTGLIERCSDIGGTSSKFLFLVVASLN